jgi:uncharacterized DUF497 family protein
MNYVWDPRKNRRNLARHRIAFEDANRDFRRPTLKSVDERFDYGEVRIYAIGIVNDLEITVIYNKVSETERRIIRHGGQNSMNEKLTGKASARTSAKTRRD